NGRNPYRQIRIVSPILRPGGDRGGAVQLPRRRAVVFRCALQKDVDAPAGVNAAALELGSKQQKHPAYVFGVSFVFALIAAFVFALWIGPSPPLGYAVGRGLLAGAGLVATSFGINYLFSARSMVLWAIDAGYHVVQFVLFGL